MAYQLLRRTAVLEFDDGDLAGAEIKCKLDLPIRKLFEIESAVASDPIEGIRLWAANALISWSIEDDGAPVPADEDGALSLPIGMVLLIVRAWITACASAPKA